MGLTDWELGIYIFRLLEKKIEISEKKLANGMSRMRAPLQQLNDFCQSLFC